MYINQTGDEIVSVNGDSLSGLSHEEAIAVFKRIRSGQVKVKVARRGVSSSNSSNSKNGKHSSKLNSVGGSSNDASSAASSSASTGGARSSG